LLHFYSLKKKKQNKKTQHSNSTGYCGGEVGKASGGGEVGVWYKHEGDMLCLWWNTLLK